MPGVAPSTLSWSFTFDDDPSSSSSSGSESESEYYDNLDGLIKVIQESKVLEELDLSDNGITLADGKFTDALAKNKTLRVLNLSIE